MSEHNNDGLDNELKIDLAFEGGERAEVIIRATGLKTLLTAQAEVGREDLLRETIDHLIEEYGQDGDEEDDGL